MNYFFVISRHDSHHPGQWMLLCPPVGLIFYYLPCILLPRLLPTADHDHIVLDSKEVYLYESEDGKTSWKSNQIFRRSNPVVSTHIERWEGYIGVIATSVRIQGFHEQENWEIIKGDLSAWSKTILMNQDSQHWNLGYLMASTFCRYGQSITTL